jgi:hypothetical protein
MRLLALLAAVLAWTAPFTAAEPSRVLRPSQPAPVVGLAVPLAPRLVDVSRDGRAASPRLVLDASAQDAALAAPLAALSAAVREAAPALRESVAEGYFHEGRMTLCDAVCGDAAPKLALVLQRLGLPVDVVEAEFHYYDLWDHSAGSLIVDPTIRQFFGGRRAPSTVPEVFAGTHAQLNRLFETHRQARTSSQPLERLYFRGAATRNEKVAELEREMTDRADLQILARYLKRREKKN